MEVKVPDLGSTGYFTKDEFKKVLQSYIGPALNGLSLAIEELQKTVDALEKASRKIEVTVHMDNSAGTKPSEFVYDYSPTDRREVEK